MHFHGQVCFGISFFRYSLSVLYQALFTFTIWLAAQFIYQRTSFNCGSTHDCLISPSKNYSTRGLRFYPCTATSIDYFLWLLKITGYPLYYIQQWQIQNQLTETQIWLIMKPLMRHFFSFLFVLYLTLIKIIFTIYNFIYIVLITFAIETN